MKKINHIRIGRSFVRNCRRQLADLEYSKEKNIPVSNRKLKRLKSCLRKVISMWETRGIINIKDEKVWSDYII